MGLTPGRRASDPGHQSTTLAKVAVAVTLSWGALAPGTTNPWATWTLIAACLVSAVLVVMKTRTLAPGAPLVVMAVTAVAITLQLVPLPAGALAIVSPATLDVLNRVAGSGASPPTTHALSVSPVATASALALFLALVVFFFAATRLLAATGARWLFVAVTVLAVVVTLARVIEPFGLLADGQQVAGWMLMVLPLALALVSQGISRRASTQSRRSAASLALAGLAVLVVLGVGASTIATRLSDADWTEVSGRLTSWSDAAEIASQFPLAGTGLNTSGVMASVEPPGDQAPVFVQPHNGYLRLLSEGGLLLVTPVLVFGVVLVREVRRRFREDNREGFAWWARAGAVSGLLAIGLLEAIASSLQIPGNAVMFTLLCAIAVHRIRRTPLPRL